MHSLVRPPRSAAVIFIFVTVLIDMLSFGVPRRCMVYSAPPGH
jgi:hypothetical protein